MRLIIIFTLLALSQARFIEPLCDLVPIYGINYEKEIIKDNIADPYQMVIDYDTNTLFFSYTVDRDVYTSDVFQSAFLNLKTNEYNTVKGIKGGFAAAVDKKTHTVYLGGRDGIYKYNYDTQAAIYTDPNGHSIWQMFYKDKLYYTTYPEEELYTFNGNVSTKVAGLEDTKVLLAAIDNNDYIYFSNLSGLYCYTKTDKKFINLGEYIVNSFTVDINNNLYFSTPEGFYNIDSNKKVNNLANIDNVYGLVVESDNNFIYGTSSAIIRLKPTKKTCMCR